jgi:hypothetical protein
LGIGATTAAAGVARKEGVVMTITEETIEILIGTAIVGAILAMVVMIIVMALGAMRDTINAENEKKMREDIRRRMIASGLTGEDARALLSLAVQANASAATTTKR